MSQATLCISFGVFRNLYGFLITRIDVENAIPHVFAGHPHFKKLVLIARLIPLSDNWSTKDAFLMGLVVGFLILAYKREETTLKATMYDFGDRLMDDAQTGKLKEQDYITLANIIKEHFALFEELNGLPLNTLPTGTWFPTDEEVMLRLDY